MSGHAIAAAKTDGAFQVTLAEAFEHQAISCIRLGSPFMGQLLNILARCWPTESDLGRRFTAFKGDVGPAGASLPLRIAGGLHALVLSDRAPELAKTYPPQKTDDAILREAVLAALSQHEGFLLDWVENPPQTNEVRRSAALMAGAAVVKSRLDLPVWVSELGASGGLNLMWDHFALALPSGPMGCGSPALTLTPEWEGTSPPMHLPEVSARAGVDLNPLDPTQPSDFLRLMAYLWPDQPDRMTLTRAAASVASVEIEKGDAIEWLAHRLDAAPVGYTHFIQHTVAWQYFPASAQAHGRALIEAAGAKATPNRPIAWLSMESDGDTKAALGAALTLKFWPGDVTLALGRVDFHGRWINWQGPS